MRRRRSRRGYLQRHVVQAETEYRIHYHNFIEGFGLRTTDFSFLR